MDMKKPTLTADAVTITAQPGQNVLEACLAAQKDIPYFCWHPALGSAGSCRQCAVKVYRGPEDTTGQVVMACMTPVTDGMRIAAAEPESSAFREQVIEFVLTSHPHDCPVCEVGGECHLQDMAVLTGHAKRRYRFLKRTHLNQELGPFLKHEMNRCIGCYRCLRFYRDYAGGGDFGVFGSNRNIYFGRAESGTLENPFAGNLAEVCPTGVFVDKPFSRRFRRKWDMRATPSVCTHCALGCNITVQERNGEFRRVQNRYNEGINGYFLCDRGRFGAGFLESPSRLRQPREDGTPLTQLAACTVLSGLLLQSKIVAIGSPRASVEANYALRALVGEEHFFAGVSAEEFAVASRAVEILRDRGIPVASVQQAEEASAVLVLGDDPWTWAPRLGLALRQAGRRAAPGLLESRQIPAWQDAAARLAAASAHGALMLATPTPSALDKDATIALRRPPEEIVALGFAVAHELNAVAPAPARLAPEAGDIATCLRGAEAPVVVVGGAACGPAVLEAAANIVLALRAQGIAARLLPVLPEANSLGLALLGARPLAEALNAAKDATVIVLENGLSRRLSGEEFARLCEDAAPLCVLDHVETATTRAASLVLATASFADGDGTYVSAMGQAQRAHKAIFGAGDPPEAWRLLRDAAREAGLIPAKRWTDHAALLTELAAAVPALAGCAAAAPAPEAESERPATLPHRYSGRAAEYAHLGVREPAPPRHPESPWGTTMEGPPARAGAALPPVVWAAGWNSVQAGQKYQTRGAGLATAAADSPTAAYYAPSAAVSLSAPLMFVPLADVFASGELAAMAPAIAERRLPPAVLLHPDTAAAAGLAQGAVALCTCNGASVRRLVVLEPSLPHGFAGLTTFLPGEPDLALPAPGGVQLVPEGAAP